MRVPFEKILPYPTPKNPIIDYTYTRKTIVMGAAAMMSKDGCNVAKLCPFSLGVGIGVAKALFMMVFAWAGWLGGYYVSMIQQMASMFHGYAPTFIGGLWGGLWGLIVGFIFGLLVGFFYDLCLCCCKKSCSKDAQ